MNCTRCGHASPADVVLAPRYAGFTEGFATRDLQAAKVLLKV